MILFLRLSLFSLGEPPASFFRIYVPSSSRTAHVEGKYLPGRGVGGARNIFTNCVPDMIVLCQTSYFFDFLWRNNSADAKA